MPINFTEVYWQEVEFSGFYLSFRLQQNLVLNCFFYILSVVLTWIFVMSSSHITKMWLINLFLLLYDSHIERYFTLNQICSRSSLLRTHIQRGNLSGSARATWARATSATKNLLFRVNKHKKCPTMDNICIFIKNWQYILAKCAQKHSKYGKIEM